ncbi:hypothetical protein AXK56_16355 [Tsukamurella pulmonis]|nr:hypothetical protein [Tsukamurella pulmonis]KXO95783.1 hypothetical protein AXK56_16355 [Tsukamurella pulmonis]
MDPQQATATSDMHLRAVESPATGQHAAPEAPAAARGGWQPSVAMPPATTAAPTRPTPSTGSIPLPFEEVSTGAIGTAKAPVKPNRRQRRAADGPKRPAKSGWRRAVRRATFGGWDPGWSDWELEEEHLVHRMRVQPRPEGENVTVVNGKGGVGKTLTALEVSETLASRLGAVLAVVANNNWDSFPTRIGQPSANDVLDLIDDPHLFYRDADGILVPQPTTSEAQFGQYTGKGATSIDRPGLELLAGPRAIACEQALRPQEYTALMEVAQRHYRVRVSDCGTNLKDPLTRAVMDLTDLVIIVVSLDAEGLGGAREALTFLRDFPSDRKGKPLEPIPSQRPYIGLAQRVVIVINEFVDPDKAAVLTPDQAVAEFTELLQNVPGAPALADPRRRIIRVPFDGHVRSGDPIRDDLLNPEYKRSFQRIAAAIADDFQRERTRRVQFPQR